MPFSEMASMCSTVPMTPMTIHTAQNSHTDGNRRTARRA